MQVNHTMWERLTTNFRHQRFVALDRIALSRLSCLRAGNAETYLPTKTTTTTKNCSKKRLKLILRKNHELQTAGRQKHPDRRKIF